MKFKDIEKLMKDLGFGIPLDSYGTLYWNMSSGSMTINKKKNKLKTNERFGVVYNTSRITKEEVMEIVMRLNKNNLKLQRNLKLIQLGI